jgi:tetratricopeptide (TPR) repeat protein
MTESPRERWDHIISADGFPALRIELLKDFVRDFPDHGPAWRRFAVALADLSRFDEAQHAFKQALRLTEPENRLWVFCDLGTMSRDMGDVSTAERWYRKAIDHSPDDAQGYILFGATLARLGRLGEAERLHRRATTCTAGCIDEAYLNLGFVLRAKEQYAAALACFD